MADLKNTLAKRAEQGVAKGHTVYDLLERQRPQIERALPRHLKADRLLRVVTTAIRMTPGLAECTPESLLGALMLSAQLGLEPGPLGHAYFLPFNNRQKGVKEVQFLTGYRGLLELAYRSGHYADIDAHTVYVNDFFEFEYGSNARLIHRPALGDRGEATYWYAIAYPLDGSKPKFRVMSKGDVEERRKRSRAKDSGPWVTDFNEMSKKTVLRALCKYLRLSVEAQVGMAADETITTSITPMDDFIPQADPETGEIIEAEATEVPSEEV